MIDNESEPGAWARELAMQPRRCEWCAHYVVRDGVGLCTLDRPLQPCEFYEREPGADG